MDSPERSPSPGDASDSDFYGVVPSPMVQPALSAPEDEQPQEANHVTAPSTDHNLDDQDAHSDASSDMDLSEDDSPSPEPEPQQTASQSKPLPKPLPSSTPTVMSNGLKRSHEESTVDGTNNAAQSSEFPNQRRKLSGRPSYATLAAARQSQTPLATVQRLPIQLWQQIFSLLPPMKLAQCLRVCKDFEQILTNVKAQPVAKKASRKPRIIDSDAVWATSRKTYCPGLPRPLPGLTELQMYQLICGDQCNVCGSKSTVPPPATTPFDCGPGPHGARPIWPFRAVLCGSCLQQHTQSDIKLLCTPAAPLRSGIPHAFLTPDGNYVTEYQRTNGGIHAQLHSQKVYFQHDIDEIIKERDEVQSFGHGTADEWQKGLRDKGKEAMTDAMRWESWEHRLRAKGRERAAGAMRSEDGDISLAPGADLTRVIRLYHVSLPPTRRMTQQHPVSAAADGPKQPQDATQAKAARRVEIVRRCMELEPPIHEDALDEMISFKNAMMIAQPMTDPAWEVLKPLLLAQRDDAERIAHQKRQDRAIMQSIAPYHYQSENRPAREVYSEDYERAQEPLRRKLSQYADDFMNLEWGNKTVDYNNSGAFATRCLLYVYRAYQEAKEAGESHHGSPPPDDGSNQSTPSEPFLSLTNMKYVFDTKIRPITDHHRRDFFVCAECVGAKEPEKALPFKYFAFEGLIQHYGAKHTDDFRKDTIVVHWQTSAWPEDPPFAVGAAAKDNSRPVRSGKSGRGGHRGGTQNGHGNRNFSGSHREEAFHPPNAGLLLSENPYFARPQSAHSTAPQDPYAQYAMNNGGYGYDHQHLQSPQYGQAYSSAAPAEPWIDRSDAAQIDKLSTDARATWDALEGVNSMLPAIKVHAVLHHAVVRFRQHFDCVPPLDLVTDALATNATIRPLKNAVGLYCKTCVGSQAGANADHKSYHERTMNAKSFNVGSLTTHYKIVHQGQSPYADWTTDMLELPEFKLVKDLLRTPGMDDSKLAVVAAAFPRAFPSPLPTIGVIPEKSEAGPDGGLASRLIDRIGNPATHDKKRRKKAHNGNTATPTRDGSGSEPLPEANEDEYDPRRPAYVKAEDDAVDPARFDTDLSRKASAPTAANGNGQYNLLPETLAALTNLTNTYAAESHRERSPSVGAPERPQSSTNKPVDIAAILASLTGEQQQQQPAIATPPASMSTRSGSAPRQHFPDPYAYQQPPLPAPQQQNVRAYDYDRPPVYAQAIEYVQLPPAEYIPAQHVHPQYAAPPPQQPQPRIFIDEHGRQIFAVPIEEVPAPPTPSQSQVQFAPRGWEGYRRGY